MPKTVTVPSTLSGHAREIWRSAFLSAYDGTCAKPEGRRGGASATRDACAAKIAWNAVKAKYRKGKGGKWVAKSEEEIVGAVPPAGTPGIINPITKALDPAMGVISEIPATTPEPQPITEMKPGLHGSKMQRWKAAYNKALAEYCRNSDNPTECARAYANKVVGRVETDVEPIEKVISRTNGKNYPFFKIKGGPGSGHHGHRGRPGEVGGSLPSGAAAAPRPREERKYGLRELEEDNAKATHAFLGFMRRSPRHKWTLYHHGLGEPGGPNEDRVRNLNEDYLGVMQAWDEGAEERVVAVPIDRETVDYTEFISGKKSLTNNELSKLEAQEYVPSRLEKRLDGMRRHKFMTAELEKKMPSLYEQEGADDPIAYAKFFHPWSGNTWYATGYNKQTGIFFGYLDTGDPTYSEWGYFSRKEMAETLAKGVPVERDKYFKPTPMSTILGKVAPAGETDETMELRSEVGEESMDENPLEEKKFYSAEQRRKMAKAGTAMKDGSFPIADCEDVTNALRSLGRTTKPRGSVIAHIRKRAKSLGCKMTPALKQKMAMLEAYIERQKQRQKLNLVDYALIERMGDQEIIRPNRISSDVWRMYPPSQKTVRAEATRRIIERNYAQAVEDAQMSGWKAAINHYQPEEYYFTKPWDTGAGEVIVRSILVRREHEVEWQLLALSTFAEGSIAKQLPPHILRHTHKNRLKIPVIRGGPGSGHHGHRGRPGEVGGSLPSGEAGGERRESRVGEYDYLGGEDISEEQYMDEMAAMFEEAGLLEEAPDDIQQHARRKKEAKPQLSERLATMELNEIAKEIEKDWKKVNFAAVPYLRAMHFLDTMDDYYGADPAAGIVAYFLSNAGSWRGDTARMVKAELKKRLKRGR